MTDVTSPSKEYTSLIADVKLNRAAVTGQRAIKEGTTTYLTPLASQLNPDGSFTPEGLRSYNKYLQLALFFNATGRTVDGLSGLIFRKDPIIELPQAIEYLIDNIEATNQSMISQMQTVVRDAFATPRSALLTDFPESSGTISRLDSERQNLRPRILFFPFESIIKTFFQVVNNKYQLALAVLLEPTSKLIGFEIEDELSYRVLSLIDGVYHHALYSEKGSVIKEPEPVLVNGQVSNEIPMYFIEPLDGKKAAIDDLVDVNLNHYNMFASYANKEHTSGFPIFWETGVQDTDADSNVDIGPGAKWTSSVIDAQFGILETAADGGSLRTYLEDRKTEMAALGAEMLTPSTSQAESGESKRLDKVAQNATTADIANTVSRAYTQAIQFAARWVGADEGAITITLNTDYIPDNMNPQLLTALLAALQSGEISYDTFYTNLQRGEIAKSDRTAEEEKTLIATDDNGM